MADYQSVGYLCPSCDDFYPAEDWDKATIDNNCYNRKQRRAYKSIVLRYKNKWYECPGCGGRSYSRDIKEVRKV